MSLGIEFNSEIRLGDLVTVVSFAIVGVSFFMNIRNRLNIQDVRLDYIDANMEDTKKTLKDSGTMEHRMNQAEKALDELRHWQGFVQPNYEIDRFGRMIPIQRTENAK